MIARLTGITIGLTDRVATITSQALVTGQTEVRGPSIPSITAIPSVQTIRTISPVPSVAAVSPW